MSKTTVRVDTFRRSSKTRKENSRGQRIVPPRTTRQNQKEHTQNQAALTM